jgi:transketolase
MWEAAMAAGHFGLDGLTVIVDRNGLQQGDRTESTVRLEPLADKWRAFGWAVRDVDGHDHAQLLAVLGSGPAEAGRPTASSRIPTRAMASRSSATEVAWHHHVPPRTSTHGPSRSSRRSSTGWKGPPHDRPDRALTDDTPMYDCRDAFAETLWT